jgi:hypothetical protein
MNAPTSDELEKAIDDIGYAILQACVAHDLYHIEVVPVLRKNGISQDTISIVNNGSLEAQLLFLRKLNEFFPQKKKTTFEPSIISASNLPDLSWPVQR